MSEAFDPASPLSFAPWRLSGLVLGVLMNDPAQWQALGPAMYEAPYKAPPRQPVLYLKPRNTLLDPWSPCCLPEGVPALAVGVSLGLVLGHTLCKTSAQAALDAVSGLVLVADLHVPHERFYRPSVPLRALDGSCRLAEPRPWQRVSALDPDALKLELEIEGRVAAQWDTASHVRSAATLLAEVSAFMTLRPGDVVMTGVRHGAPLLRARQRALLRAQGVGELAVTTDSTALAAVRSGPTMP